MEPRERRHGASAPARPGAIVVTNVDIQGLARECGFELAGVTPATPVPEAEGFLAWVGGGMAGKMGYLTDHRAVMRQDPRRLLSSARSVICVAQLYNGPEPLSTEFTGAERAWISRYAWGDDYHDVLRRGLKQFDARLREVAGEKFESRICVDTAPFLDAAYARHAGLGWIGKHTCLINQNAGSWFFLGALLVSLDLTAGAAPPERCGTCTRCIDACPTQAIVPFGGGWTVDARRCISYLTIELRGSIPEPVRARIGRHVFGCDICQDVCPWNRTAPTSRDGSYAPRWFAPLLEKLAALTEQEFRRMFRGTPVRRAHYHGFLRNVAVAIGNSGSKRLRPSAERLLQAADPVIREHAAWALERL